MLGPPNVLVDHPVGEGNGDGGFWSIATMGAVAIKYGLRPEEWRIYKKEKRKHTNKHTQNRTHIQEIYTISI